MPSATNALSGVAPRAPAVTDLAFGQVQCLVADISSALAMLQNGRVRALAVPYPQRHPLLPDVPTYAEVTAILRTAEVREMLLKRGITASPSSREEATRYQREQLQI